MVNKFASAILWPLLALSVGLAHADLLPPCPTSPRIVGAFGAENAVDGQIAISQSIRQQLPNLVAVRMTLKTDLSPSGEMVIIYDTSTDESDPQPRMAFVLQNKIMEIISLSEATKAPGGFERFLAACEFHVAPNTNGLALAVSTGYDGAESGFAIFRWMQGHYSVIFNAKAAQARLVLDQDRLSLWEGAGGGCTWCPQRYRIRHYQWLGNKYVATAVTSMKKQLNPALVSGVSLLLASRSARH